MKFSLTSDSDYYTRVGNLGIEISNSGFSEKFENQDYGLSLNELGVLFLCNEVIPIETKPRIRLSKKELILYMDIILSYEEMMEADQETRKKIMATRLLSDTAKVIAKYKFKDFDLPRFLHDLEAELKRIGFLPET